MRGLLVGGLTVVAILVMAGAAVAVKPDGKPGRPTTTTTAAPEYWTCQERVDHGAIWVLPDAEDPYSVADVAACIDVLAADIAERDWTVVWNGSAERVKGLKLVFEEEVHANILAERVFTTATGHWCPSFSDEAAYGNLVFVVMPHSADKWDAFQITITPGHVGECATPDE